MNVIAIANRKGGVAKTTTAINFSYALGLKRYKVLLVDLDPMRGATFSLGLTSDFGIEDYLEERRAFKDCIFKGHIIDILPAGPGLTNLEERLYREIPGTFKYLAEHFKKELLNYDFTILDCGPAVSALMVNALSFCNNIIIPVRCDYMSLEALADMLQDIGEIKRSKLNPDLNLLAIVPTFYSQHLNICKYAVTELKSKFHKVITKTYIRTNSALSEAPAYSKSIFSYKGSSYGAQDYNALTTELLKRIKRGE